MAQSQRPAGAGAHRRGARSHPVEHTPPPADAETRSSEPRGQAGQPRPAADAVAGGGTPPAEGRAPAPGVAPAGEETTDLAARIAELEAALAAAKAEASENWDKYLRERAEMENYKKRIERTYADLARRGRKDFLLKILGVMDNLERAVSYESSSGHEVDAKSLLTGLRLIHSQFRDLLGAEGLKEIPALGERFDPAVHEAVATEEVADKPDGEIVAELQKGYLYDDELLRPARVRVATRGSG